MKQILYGLVFAMILSQIAFAQMEESVNVELVETFVSALDSKGNPVTDLSTSDFSIKEDRPTRCVFTASITFIAH